MPLTVTVGAVVHAELLCERVDVHPTERVLDVAARDYAVALAAARRWADVTQAADACHIPFDDDTFDAVLSAFGATSSSDAFRVADELVRVCRPAGRVGLTAWSQGSFVDDVLQLATGRRTEWDSASRIRDLFGNRINELHVEARTFTFRYPSAEQMLAWFRTSYAPPVDVGGELIELFRRNNRADDGTLVVTSDYLEIVAVVR